MKCRTSRGKHFDISHAQNGAMHKQLHHDEQSNRVNPRFRSGSGLHGDRGGAVARRSLSSELEGEAPAGTGPAGATRWPDAGEGGDDRRRRSGAAALKTKGVAAALGRIPRN